MFPAAYLHAVKQQGILTFIMQKPGMDPKLEVSVVAACSTSLTPNANWFMLDTCLKLKQDTKVTNHHAQHLDTKTLPTK